MITITTASSVLVKAAERFEVRCGINEMKRLGRIGQQDRVARGGNPGRPVRRKNVRMRAASGRTFHHRGSRRRVYFARLDRSTLVAPNHDRLLTLPDSA